MTRPSKDQRRTQILGAMATCIAEDGIQGATMRRVAERANASTGMLTHYYNNKKELMVDTLIAAQEHSAERINEIAGASTGVRRLEAVMKVQLARDTEALPWSFWLEYWAMATRDYDLREQHIEHLQQLKLDIQRSVEAGISEGTLRQDLDPTETADMILALITGLGVNIAVDAPGSTASQATVIGSLLIGLLQR